MKRTLLSLSLLFSPFQVLAVGVTFYNNLPVGWSELEVKVGINKTIYFSELAKATICAGQSATLEVPIGMDASVRFKASEPGNLLSSSAEHHAEELLKVFGSSIDAIGGNGHTLIISMHSAADTIATNVATEAHGVAQTVAAGAQAVADKVSDMVGKAKVQAEVVKTKAENAYLKGKEKLQK